MPPRYQLHHADCCEILSTLADQSVDAVITDPPYPEISRDYGRLTEPEWHELMEGVVRETRRLLRPQGSAVFILQPNSERVGRMRPWLWEFLLKNAQEWNLIQDVYWWNHATLPSGGCQRQHGLLRPSVKYCLWFGPADCYRKQEAILWSPSEALQQRSRSAKWETRCSPSGHVIRSAQMVATAKERGGVTPFNLIPVANTVSNDSAGSHGHGAGTPLKLCEWWTRYIVPPGGQVLDMFAGTATTGIAALRQGKRWVGIESMEKYAEIAESRLAAETELREEDPHHRLFPDAA